MRRPRDGRYCLDDLDDRMVDSLPPFMVPRQATRGDPPAA